MNKKVIVAWTAHVRNSDAPPIVSAAQRLAKMQNILDAAPPVNKQSTACRIKEENILGYGATGHFE